MTKKAPDLQPVHHTILTHLHPAHVEVDICRADELAQRRGLVSALDERWSDVGQQAEPRWLWHASDHHRGAVLAYVFGRRQDTVVLELQDRLEPCGSPRFDTDGWGAYERHLAPEQPQVGTANTQKIERQHIHVRTRITRLVRRTMGLSNTPTRHDLVLGLVINRYEFGRSV